MHSIYLAVVLPKFLAQQEAIGMGFLCLPRMMKSFSFSDRRFIEKTSIPKRSTIFSLSTSQKSSSQISQAAGRLQSEHLCALIRVPWLG